MRGQDMMGRSTAGMIRASVSPSTKLTIVALVEHDARFRSVSHLVDVALAYYLHQYKDADHCLDGRNFPITGRKPFTKIPGGKKAPK